MWDMETIWGHYWCKGKILKTALFVSHAEHITMQRLLGYMRFKELPQDLLSSESESTEFSKSTDFSAKIKKVTVEVQLSSESFLHILKTELTTHNCRSTIGQQMR
jgi:hypothetical protein